MELERQQYHYYAFVSYSSADGKWAKWIQSKLEGYRLPIALRKESIDMPKRITPVFRDTTDLSTGVLKDVLQTGANDVYVVTTKEGKEILLPVIDECILDVSLEENKVTAHIMPGLLD